MMQSVRTVNTASETVEMIRTLEERNSRKSGGLASPTLLLWRKLLRSVFENIVAVVFPQRRCNEIVTKWQLKD